MSSEEEEEEDSYVESEDNEDEVVGVVDVDELLDDITKRRANQFVLRGVHLSELQVLQLVNAFSLSRCVRLLHLEEYKLESAALEPLFAFLKSEDCTVKNAVFRHCLPDKDAVVTRQLADVIAANKSLVSLSVAENSLYMVGGFVWLGEALLHNRTLTELDVSETLCGVAGATSIVRNGKCLEKIVFFGNELGFESDLKEFGSALKVHENLRCLDLSFNEMHAEKPCRMLADVLKVNTRLEKLKLIGEMTNDAVAILCEGLRENCTLLRLVMSYGEIGVDGAKHLVQYLRSPNASLQKLCISSNPLGNEGVRVISEAFKNDDNCSRLQCLLMWRVDGNCMTQFGRFLMHVNLSGNILAPNDGRALGESLQNASVLSELTLDLTYPTFVDFSHICEGLKMNTSLRQLYLSSNALNAKCAVLLRDALANNKNVKLLSVAKNNFGQEGAEALGEMLKLNNTMKELLLNQNNLGPDGARFIFDALMINETLETLDISKNHLALEGATSMAQMLRANSTLTRLVAKENNFCQKSIWLIAEAIKLNKGLAFFSPFMNALHFGDMVDVNQNVDILYYDRALTKNGLKRRLRVQMCVITMLSIRKFKKSPLNVHPKEIVEMIAKVLMQTVTDLYSWRVK